MAGPGAVAPCDVHADGAAAERAAGRAAVPRGAVQARVGVGRVQRVARGTRETHQHRVRRVCAYIASTALRAYITYQDPYSAPSLGTQVDAVRDALSTVVGGVGDEECLTAHLPSVPPQVEAAVKALDAQRQLLLELQTDAGLTRWNDALLVDLRFAGGCGLTCVSSALHSGTVLGSRPNEP